MARPRIAPVEPPYDHDTAAMLERWMPPGAAVEPLALFRTFAVHPDLAARMRPLGAGILGHGKVEPRLREVMIDRTCARSGAAYEWGVHAVAFGPAVGLSAEQLASTAAGTPQDGCWDADGALVMELADELAETATVSDVLFDRLRARFADDEILELVITAGWYRTIAYVINACAIEPEPWAAPMPAGS